jgi:hypothetical protein
MSLSSELNAINISFAFMFVVAFVPVQLFGNRTSTTAIIALKTINFWHLMVFLVMCFGLALIMPIFYAAIVVQSQQIALGLYVAKLTAHLILYIAHAAKAETSIERSTYLLKGETFRSLSCKDFLTKVDVEYTIEDDGKLKIIERPLGDEALILTT